MKQRHIKLMVCLCVRHTVLYISFKKYYLLARTRLDMIRTRVKRYLDVRRTRLDMAWIRTGCDLVLFFSII